MCKSSGVIRSYSIMLIIALLWYSRI